MADQEGSTTNAGGGSVLKLRVITALILGPLVLAAVIWLPQLYFAGLFLLVVILGAREWAVMLGFRRLGTTVFMLATLPGAWAGLWLGVDAVWVLSCLAVLLWFVLLQWVIRYPRGANQWSSTWLMGLLGLLILNLALVFMIYLKSTSQGVYLILLLLMMIWGADIGAYFSGRAFGRRKLAPAVSPGKTWAGVWGGLLVSVVATCLLALAFGLLDAGEFENWLGFAGLALVTSSFSIVGDLFESLIKRQRGVKDSGQLLPGHGGMLDRIDSLVAALPFYVFLLLLSGMSL